MIDTIIAYVMACLPALASIAGIIAATVKTLSANKIIKSEVSEKMDKATSITKQNYDKLEKEFNELKILTESLIKENARLYKKVNKCIESITHVQETED